MADLSHKSFRYPLDNTGKTDAETAAAREFVSKRLAAITRAKPVQKTQVERAPRKSVYKLAKLFTSKIDSVRCVVVNLSADGARVTMEDAYDLPEIVVLRFEQTGVKKKARIAWRQDREIGLSFIKDEQREDQE